jgi:hypothetical protein
MGLGANLAFGCNIGGFFSSDGSPFSVSSRF